MCCVVYDFFTLENLSQIAQIIIATGAVVSMYQIIKNVEKDKKTVDAMIKMKEFFELQMKKEELNKIHHHLLSKMHGRIFSNKNKEKVIYTKQKTTDDISESMILKILNTQKTVANEINNPAIGDQVWRITEDWFESTAQKMNLGVYDFLILEEYDKIVKYYKEKKLM